MSAPLNVVTTLLVFAPVDRAGAAVELAAIDADSREQLAALTHGHFAPMCDIGARFRKLAPAEIALKKAASEFAVLLQPDAAAVR